MTEWHKEDATENEWLHWRPSGDMFEARCGPEQLSYALSAFRDFADPGQT